MTAAATLVWSDTLVPHAAGRVVGHLATNDDTLDELAGGLSAQLATLAPDAVEAAGGPAGAQAALRAAIDETAFTAMATEIGEALGRGMLDGSDPGDHLAAADADAFAAVFEGLADTVGPPLASALREHRDALVAPVGIGDSDGLDAVLDGSESGQSERSAHRAPGGADTERTTSGGLRRAAVPLAAAALALTVVIVVAARAARPPRWLGIGAVVVWLVVAGAAGLSASRGSVGAMVLSPAVWAWWPAAVVVAAGSWLFSRGDRGAPAAPFPPR